MLPTAEIAAAYEALDEDLALFRSIVGITLGELKPLIEEIGSKKFNEAIDFANTYSLLELTESKKGRKGPGKYHAFITVTPKTREVLRTLSGPGSGHVLIIHGHDERNVLALKELLRRNLCLPEPIVMADESIHGATLPEKFEDLAVRADFAIALLSPDDEGKAVGDEKTSFRARQNTFIEIGWFWGRLGRARVLILVKSGLEIPSDLQGVEVHVFRDKVEEQSEKIRAFFEAHGVLPR